MITCNPEISIFIQVGLTYTTISQKFVTMHTYVYIYILKLTAGEILCTNLVSRPVCLYVTARMSEIDKDTRSKVLSLHYNVYKFLIYLS